MFKCSPDSPIDMNEIAKELEEIEAKYTPKTNKKCPRIPLALHENLEVLSKEFDCLGLDGINCAKTMPEILEQVVKSARDLVQIHRNTVNQIKEKNMETVARDYKQKELYFKMDDYKESLEKLKETCMSLKNGKAVLAKEVKELKERELVYKEELQKVKRMYNTRERVLEHNVQKLKIEIERLKEICGKGIGSDTSKNEVALMLLKKHTMNEEIYKSTIEKLQQNNQDLLDEILSLKEEVIVQRAKK